MGEMKDELSHILVLVIPEASRQKKGLSQEQDLSLPDAFAPQSLFSVSASKERSE